MQSNSFKIFSILLILMLIFLQYHLWFESGGIIDMLRLKKELAMKVEQNNKLKKRNEELLQQVKGVKNNAVAVESSAREELGMIKKGEVFYQIAK